jgi:glycosyltransferase involved in cell wall biosynthesis
MAPVSNARLDMRWQAPKSATSQPIPGMSERTRVAFLVRGLGIGGAQRQLMALARSLDQKTFDVTVLTLYKGGSLSEDLRGTAVRVIQLDKKNRWDVIGFFVRLARVCRSLRPHILHSYLPGQNVISMLLKPLLPKSKIVWGIRAADFDRDARDWLSMLTLRLQALLSRFADLIIFNSNAGKQFHLAHGVAATRAVVIHNGIDTVRFSPDRRRGLRLRASWHVPDGALVIGVVGRIVPVKDYATFLQAAARFATVRPQTRFACIGSGSPDFVRSLHHLATQLGLERKVLWPGELVEELPDGYNAMDIYCSSSHAEGTSNVILEAMACGVPCVVTDVGDSRVIVGQTGVVVPSRDPEALADGLELMARRLTREPQLRLAARERIVSSFNIDLLAQKTAKALTDLL